LIATLEVSPDIIVGLVREMPPQNLKRRPAPNKWSAHEHACHITTGDAPVLSRLELMLSDPHPHISSMIPSPDEEAGTLRKVDLDEALSRYMRERARLVKRLKGLTIEDWQRTAEHEEYSHYSVLIMSRHLLMHEMLHADMIEELMLKRGWESATRLDRSLPYKRFDRSAVSESLKFLSVLHAAPGQPSH
jgi:hypothetical protein